MRATPVILILLVVLAAAGYGALHISNQRAMERHAAEATGGDPRKGREIVGKLGCVACHVTPGVPGTQSSEGPSLEGFGARAQLAVTADNTPENLMKFLRDPRAIAPQSVMPKLPMSEQEVRDAAAFLFTLQ